MDLEGGCKSTPNNYSGQPLHRIYAPGQAVAVRVAGDNAAFYGCVIKSYQDTLLDDDGNHYFKNCYIEGATDFICGNASSLYESEGLHSDMTECSTTWRNVSYTTIKHNRNPRSPVLAYL
ncbi:hypothetical protein YC2023_054011 [Brassica napus]